jgi:hypothetical protein
MNPSKADRIVTTKFEINTLIKNSSIKKNSVALQSTKTKKELNQNLIYSIKIFLLDLKTKNL